MRFLPPKFFVFSFLTLVMTLASQAHAHRYHFGITEFSVNERTQTLEISHRFFVADVERALSLSADKEMKDAQKQMEAYVNQHFQLKSEAGAVVKPSWVGMESDVHDVWIYQEIPLKNVQGKSFVVRQSMLMEIERDQVNTLNLTRDGSTQSFTLKPGASVVEIKL